MQSRCVANPNSASGTANIADTKLQLDIAGNKIDLVEFPANPNPNTKVLTDLDEVLDAIINALRVDINETLDGLLAPLQAIIDPVQDQLVDQLVAQIADQLGPLEDNILDATLNKQTTSAGGKKIEVTALELKLLPAEFGPALVTSSSPPSAVAPTAASMVLTARTVRTAPTVLTARMVLTDLAVRTCLTRSTLVPTPPTA